MIISKFRKFQYDISRTWPTGARLLLVLMWDRHLLLHMRAAGHTLRNWMNPPLVVSPLWVLISHICLSQFTLEQALDPIQSQIVIINPLLKHNSLWRLLDIIPNLGWKDWTLLRWEGLQREHRLSWGVTCASHYCNMLINIIHLLKYE